MLLLGGQESASQKDEISENQGKVQKDRQGSQVEEKKDIVS